MEKMWYCIVGTMWAEHKTLDNFGHHYIPHLFNKYKEKHSTTLTLDVNEEHFTAEPCVIHYKGSRYDNNEDLCGFLNYLDNNSHGAKFSIELIGEDDNDIDIVHSWNHFDIKHRCE